MRGGRGTGGQVANVGKRPGGCSGTYRREQVEEAPERGQSEVGHCAEDVSCLNGASRNKNLNQFVFILSNHSCQLIFFYKNIT